MSAQEDADTLIALDRAAREKAENQLATLLGNPPADAAAVRALRSGINTLNADIIRLAAADVLAALGRGDPALTNLSAVTDKAKKAIKDIQDLADILTAVGAVVDLSVAVVGLATAAAAGNPIAIGTAVQDVADKVTAMEKAASPKTDDKTQDTSA